MTNPRVESQYGDPPPPVCPRCARRVDMEAIGPQVGLCHCLSCQRYACRWCWLKARGRCPMCAAPYEVWGAAAAPVVAARSHRRRRKLDRRAAAMLIALIAVLSVVSLSAIGWLGSVGGAEGRATARPGVGAGGSPTGPGSSVANAGDPTASADASGIPSGGPSGQPGASDRSNPTPAPGNETGATAAPTPRSTPAPTPHPTPAPTPRPTPRPTPAPTPTPCVTVPNLVGMTVANARAAWTGAGFTGAFSPAGKGRDAWIVDDQTQAAGACIAPTSAISVHSHKP
jgi:hypothetical protein